MAKYKYKLNEMSKKASAEDAEKELGIPKSSFEVGQVSFSNDGTSKSTITNIDDVTGAVSWKIEQLPGFDKLYQEVDQFVDAAKRVFQKTKDDKKFIEIYDDARKVKNKIRTHLRNNYTDIYKRLQMRGIAEEDIEEISTSGGAGSYLTKYAFKKPKKKKVDEASKNPGATLGPGPKAGADGVKDNYYVKAFGYKLAPSVKNRKSKVIDYRQLWKENHMYNQTLSEAENDVEQFQQKRINDFDELEKRLDVLQKKLKQGKLSTIRYYREKPESYSVVYGTDMINDYFNDIETLLTQDD
tara:strand:- start:203 stop:1096 length:894 start_codon:yes stop_codon:yes gene_type:complete